MEYRLGSSLLDAQHGALESGRPHSADASPPSHASGAAQPTAEHAAHDDAWLLLDAQHSASPLGAQRRAASVGVGLDTHDGATDGAGLDSAAAGGPTSHATGPPLPPPLFNSSSEMAEYRDHYR